MVPRARRIFSGVIGQSRIQTPTASWMATATAGAVPFMLISDTDFPPKGPKGSSVGTRIALKSGGMSPIMGTL